MLNILKHLFKKFFKYRDIHTSGISSQKRWENYICMEALRCFTILSVIIRQCILDDLFSCGRKQTIRINLTDHHSLSSRYFLYTFKRQNLPFQKSREFGFWKVTFYLPWEILKANENDFFLNAIVRN